MPYEDRTEEIVSLLASKDAKGLATLCIELNSRLLGRYKPRKRSEEPTSWVGRLGDFWRARVGAVSYPRFGKCLGQLVTDYGEDEVLKALERYVTSDQRSKVIEWFANDFHRWRQPKYTGPLIERGWLSDEFERATRP